MHVHKYDMPGTRPDAPDRASEVTDGSIFVQIAGRR
jgi:hypothetical protein